MRSRLFICLALAFAGFVTFSFSNGQEQMATAPTRPASPATNAATSATTPPSATTARDYSRLTDLQKQMPLCVQRGAEWLFRMNDVKGRFVYGYIPALRLPLEGNHLLAQAGAAFALARAARFTGDERYTARATQAILTLLDETTVDKNAPQIRYTVLPSTAVNRLGAAGLLVLAVHELPAPGADLLDKAEQLCNYIHRQARQDGSLACAEPDDDGKIAPDDPEAVFSYPGMALYGLLRSNKLRPAPWKLDVARKALVYYRTWWKTHKDPTFIPWQTAAYVELYLSGKDPGCAEFVTEMNDFLCGLQYDQIEPRHQQWYGGFSGWADGQQVENAPQVDSAIYAESLASACRVARELGDVARYERYSTALERCFQFLITLQYTDANTDHFAPWFRDKLVGGFHASHQDGNLRIDYNGHVVSALVPYLELISR